MNRFIDIENNIGKFIEDYHRNYNYARSHLKTPESDHSDSQLRHKSTQLHQKQFNTNVNDPKFDTNTLFSFADHGEKSLRRSLSFISINSQLLTKPTEQMDKWANRKCKSESDLLDLLNYRNYVYYFDELSIDKTMNSSEVNDDNVNDFIILLSDQEKAQIE